MITRSTRSLAIIAGLACGLAAMATARAEAPDGSGDATAVTKDATGKYLDKDGNPTFKVQADGTLDWFAYSGFRRYHSECHVCHGPEGEGSSYAPALKESLKTLSYADFMNVVVNGRINVNSAQNNVMPAFGTNSNVMCYLDDIFVYIRARTHEAVPRGRPAGREDKTPAQADAEKACLPPG